MSIENRPEKLAVIPMRGFAGKSRFSTEKGGPFTNSTRVEFVKALLDDTYQAIKDSNIFDRIIVATPANQELLKFIKIKEIEPFILSSETYNEQLEETYTAFANYERILLIASDLPFVDPQSLQRLDSEMDKLMQKHGSGLIVCPSRDLGSATIYLGGFSKKAPALGLSVSNLTTQLVLYHELPKKVVLEVGNYFDFDEPVHLAESLYLLRYLKPEAETYKFLLRNKWDFLLPSESEQEKVLSKFGELLTNSKFESVIDSRDIFDDGVFVSSIINDGEITIFLTTSFLANELMSELEKSQRLYSLALSVKWGRYEKDGKEYDIRIAVFGIPCQKTQKVLMDVIKQKGR